MRNIVLIVGGAVVALSISYNASAKDTPLRSASAQKQVRRSRFTTLFPVSTFMRARICSITYPISRCTPNSLRPPSIGGSRT